MQRNRTSRLILSCVFTFAVFAVLLVGFWFRQDAYDWLRLRQYQPSAAIAQLAEHTTMTPKATHLFYVHHPVLADKVSFNEHCRENEQTIVLGCYVANRGIYLFDVTDSRLSGVEEVTAAHEMLHAAYDRLSADEKQRVNQLIHNAYSQVTDERIKKVIGQYQKMGADTDNELHSILGTEVATLPAELEQYYSRYFANRQAVVTFSEKYEAVLSQRKDQVADYDQRLSALKAEIDENQNDLDQESEALKGERQRLNSLLSNNQVEAYNAGVNDFNEKVRTLNAKVNQTRGLIEEYNNLVKERNNIALEEQELIKSLDSRLTNPTEL